jgi:hypothetical protein
MTGPAPRLPKAVEADPRAVRIAARLAADPQPLRPDGSLRIATIPLDAALADALRSARTANRVRRGLESIAAALDAEAHGLAQVDRESGVARGARLSRLLFVTNDGADRFYRHVETLLVRHAARVQGLRLDASAAELGALLFGPDAIARVVLLEHKDAVAAALFSIAGPKDTET